MKLIEVYNFVKQYKANNNGNSPSFDDIMEACNISSKSTVKYYLLKLQEQGYLEFDGVRSITIPNSGWAVKE